MSAGVIVDEIKIMLLDQRTANPPFDTAEMGLSEANITPDHATIAADLTADEVTVTGYARQALTGWTTPTLDGSFIANTTAAPVTFLNTSGGDSGTIYCWFIIDSVSGLLIMAGRFSTPFVVVATSGAYTTTPYAKLTGF